MIRLIYNTFFYLLLPIILLRLIWRGFRAPAYWQRWRERFGFLPKLSIKSPIWIHAVSMGEVQAAVPLVQALLTHFPAQTFLITTMTPTGSQRVRDIFGSQVWHVYLPYDLPGAMARFFRQVQPRLLILMETELWPNLLYTCQQQAIPVILANARLSAQSASRYQRLGNFMAEIFAGISMVAAQTQLDAARFRQLGMPDAKIQVTGSLKFDTRLPTDFSTTAQKLRQQWGEQKVVWIAASTHEGEEEIVLETFHVLKLAITNLLLILVPRHPERFQRVALLCQRRGFTTVKRSEEKSFPPNLEIYLADTMGELPLLYAAGDIAFVGGSLVPIGGHNLLEPAAVGLPIIVGPYTFECEAICQQLITAGAVHQITQASELAPTVKQCLTDMTLTEKMGKSGQAFVEQNRGALTQLLAIISGMMEMVNSE